MTAAAFQGNLRRRATVWESANGDLENAPPLRRARYEAQLTQSGLGARARLARETVLRAEKGDAVMSEGTWAALALALGKDRDEIRP